MSNFGHEPCYLWSDDRFVPANTLISLCVFHIPPWQGLLIMFVIVDTIIADRIVEPQYAGSALSTTTPRQSSWPYPLVSRLDWIGSAGDSAPMHEMIFSHSDTLQHTSFWNILTTSSCGTSFRSCRTDSSRSGARFTCSASEGCLGEEKTHFRRLPSPVVASSKSKDSRWTIDKFNLGVNETMINTCVELTSIYPEWHIPIDPDGFAQRGIHDSRIDWVDCLYICMHQRTENTKSERL